MIRKLIPVVVAVGLMALFAIQVFAKEITVRGRLQRTVEAGSWVIVSGDQKYLLLNARRFQKEKWFVEAADVEAVGETKSDVMTTSMEGTPFEVRTMRPVQPRRSRRKPKRVQKSYQSVGNWRLDSASAVGHRDSYNLSFQSGQTCAGGAAG